MPYTSSLTDREWEIIKPLLPEKKRTRPPKWSKREILDGILYQLKNGCNWCDLPKDLPPYSTVFWHYKQWRSEGIIEDISFELHAQVRERIKKKRKWTSYFLKYLSASNDFIEYQNKFFKYILKNNLNCATYQTYYLL